MSAFVQPTHLLAFQESPSALLFVQQIPLGEAAWVTGGPAAEKAVKVPALTKPPVGWTERP